MFAHLYCKSVIGKNRWIEYSVTIDHSVIGLIFLPAKGALIVIITFFRKY